MNVKEVYTFLKNKAKLRITNVTIWFNTECLRRGLASRYVVVKVPRDNSAAKRTKKQAERLRVKNAIKELYKKVRDLNKAL